MALSLVTPPAGEPIALAEAKAHLRVTDDDENDLIYSLIIAAREQVETFTHRALLTQTWDLQIDRFPHDAWLDVPMAPLVSVTSVSYVDTAGATQTWNASYYLVDGPSGPHARPGRLAPVYGQIWPITRTQPNAATVRFVAGYGLASAVPASIKAAMKVLIGGWWVNREPSDHLNSAVEALLWPFKAF